MALVLKDRISETTTTTGTGTITLGGATPGFQPFSSIGDTNTTYYCVTSGAAWEVGIGTYASSGNTLARTTILANSNNNTSPITLGAGSKVVFSVYPADRAVVVDGTTIQIPNNAVLPVANGGTGSNTAAFSGANITDLNATAITAGTIANNRTTASSSNGASTIVQRDAAGDFSANIITANSYSGSGASLTSLNASSISSGTLGVARGGTGAATLDANNVILGNGTSAVQFVAPGTSANVLTSNGTSWVSQAPAAGGGGSLVYLNTYTASNSVVDITGFDNSTYTYFMVYFFDVRATLGFRFYVGGTLNSTANYCFTVYQWPEDGAMSSPVWSVANASTVGRIGSTAVPNTANLGYVGRMYIYPAGGYSTYDFTNSAAIITAAAGGGFNFFAVGGGSFVNSSPVDGIRFFTSSAANLVTGTFKLYGLKAS